MTREQVLVDKDKLEKLVDRETPKSVNIIKLNADDWPEYEYYCPWCNDFLNCYLSDPYKYCPHCGQAIRWALRKERIYKTMARVITTNGKLKAGAYMMPGKKRPALCIEQDGVIKVYGSFSSEEHANEFMDKLGELVGAQIEPRKEKK